MSIFASLIHKLLTPASKLAIEFVEDFASEHEAAALAKATEIAKEHGIDVPPEAAKAIADGVLAVFKEALDKAL